MVLDWQRSFRGILDTRLGGLPILLYWICGLAVRKQKHCAVGFIDTAYHGISLFGIAWGAGRINCDKMATPQFFLQLFAGLLFSILVTTIRVTNS